MTKLIIRKKELDFEGSTSLYLQVVNVIKKHIREGDLNPGDGLAPEYELAATLGISVGTLKKALNLLVKEGLIYRRPKLGTFVGRKAPEGVRGNAKNIAFILCNHRIPDHSFSTLFYVVEQGCKENNFTLQFMTLKDNESADALQRNFAETIDGVILAGVITRTIVEMIKKQGIPCVLFGDPKERWAGDRFLNKIDSPVEKIVRTALDYLYAKGHVRIAFLLGTAGYPYYDRMLRTYLDFAKTHSLEKNYFRVKGEISREEEGYALAENIIRRVPDAVLCANDNLAVGAIKRLRENGVSIPDDVSVLGIGDTPLASFSFPPLTTVAEASDAGRKSVSFLKEVIEGKKKRKFVLDGIKIIERESVKTRV